MECVNEEIRQMNAYRWMTVCILMIIAIGCNDNCSNNQNIGADRDFTENFQEEDEEIEGEVRERPSDPYEAEYPKTLWRDEVETGHTFTWGFFPRKYFSNINKYNVYFPMVWDQDKKRILAVDPAQNHINVPHDFIIYSLSEESSEILDYIDFPEIDFSVLELSEDRPWILGMVLYDGKLIISFQKGVWHNGSPDYELLGLISYDISTKNIRYKYATMCEISECNFNGIIRMFDGNHLIVRTNMGFSIFDLLTEELVPISSNCESNPTNYLSCSSFTYLKSIHYSFIWPKDDEDGYAIFDNRLVSLKKEDDFTISMVSTADSSEEDCKDWLEFEECESTNIPFSLDCCINSRNIVLYNNTPYILSFTDSTLLKIDWENERFERKAGITLAAHHYALSPDGTPAIEALLGTPQDWLVTPDGDLMWFSPADFSVRGIAGPLDEWAE